jgi:hypothetical protein
MRIHRAATSGTCMQDGRRFPRRYVKCDDCNEKEVLQILQNEELLFESPEPEDCNSNSNPSQEEARLVVYTPPAVTSADSYNVLKFYALDNDIVKSLLSRMIRREPSHRPGYATANVDVVQEYPFIPDEVMEVVLFVHVCIHIFVCFCVCMHLGLCA